MTLKYITFFILSGVLSSTNSAQKTEKGNNTADQVFKTFPIPKQHQRSLFYIQRNKNANTIVYDANILPGGKLDPVKPIDVYWIRYADNSQRQELNYIEDIFAYGLKFTELKGEQYEVSFVASHKKKLLVYLDKNGKPYCEIDINGRTAELEKIYIKANDTNWWPTVDYVDLIGRDVRTGGILRERILP